MVGRTVSPEFIGRSAELDRAAAILDASNTSPTHLLVAGEAGVGKTRFSRELERQAAARGIRVLRGGCIAIGGVGLPYAPFTAALRDVLRDPELSGAIAPREAAALGHLVPGLSADAARAGPTAIEGPALRGQLFEAVLGVLRRLAMTSPLLVVIEDIHWADPATRDAITFLLPNLANERVHLALTFRSDELDRRDPLLPWLAELGRQGDFERIDLARFSRDETARLVTTIAGEELPAEEIDRLHGRSDGNAFFIEELLLAGGGGISVAGLPATVRATLIARIEAVPETAHRVLRVAAVAGRRVDHELLAAVSGLSDADLTDGLRAAIDGQLLVLEGDRDEGYAFRHALVQEAVHDDLLPGERRSLHRAYAEALESSTSAAAPGAAAHWAELAHHWSAARDDIRAAIASIRAGAEAEAAFAFVAAQRQYENALELWDSVPEPEVTLGLTRIDLLVQAAGAAELSGDFRRMADLVREAIGGRDAVADPVRGAVLRESLGRALWLVGDTDASLESYAEAIRVIPADQPSAERAQVLAGMGQILMLTDRLTESIAYCTEARAIARAVGDRRIESDALNSLGISLAILGHCREGVEALQTALAIAIEIGAAEAVGRAYTNLIDAMRLCSLDRPALDVVESGIAAVDGMGMVVSFGPPVRQGGVLVAFETGEWEIAGRLAAEADRIDRPGLNAQLYHLTYTIGLAVGRGDADAGARLRLFRELMSGRHELEAQYAGQYSLAAAEHALWAGNPEDAAAAVELGLRWIAPKEFRMYLCRIHGMAARVEADRAERARAARRPRAEIDAGLARIDSHLAAIETAIAAHGSERAATAELDCTRLAAIAERSRADGASDPSLWQAAAAAWEARDRVYEAVQARWREGEAWLLRGDRVAARAVLSDARRWAVERGARPLQAEIDGLVRRARIDLDEAAPAGPNDRALEHAASAAAFGLTRREREVLALLVEGRSNRQIAERLFISENTAGVHVSNILGKLNAVSRTEAATIAHRLGLVADPGDADASAAAGTDRQSSRADPVG